MDENLIQLQTRCVSHEIRNHVSICEMYTEIIKKNLEKNGIENDSLTNAVSCIKKSLRIIENSLIDLKSINSIEQKVFDLKFLIEESIRLSEAYIHDKDIKINSLIKKTANIFVDDNKFLACVVNIIKNAIEAIEVKGEINVIADVCNDMASVKILNNGKMISAEKRKFIFDEGYTTKQTGNGLGLLICKNNLRNQNAELRLNKSTKSVTEFEIIIPVYAM